MRGAIYLVPSCVTARRVWSGGHMDDYVGEKLELISYYFSGKKGYPQKEKGQRQYRAGTDPKRQSMGARRRRAVDNRKRSSGGSASHRADRRERASGSHDRKSPEGENGGGQTTLKKDDRANASRNEERCKRRGKARKTGRRKSESTRRKGANSPRKMAGEG